MWRGYHFVISALPDRLSSLQFCRIEIFGFRLGENSQNISQVARGAPDFLCASALQAPAKSFSEFQENTFVVRIAELRLGPLLDGAFRFENTVSHLRCLTGKGLFSSLSTAWKRASINMSIETFAMRPPAPARAQAGLVFALSCRRSRRGVVSKPPK
jgi:hypothetical protein